MITATAAKRVEKAGDYAREQNINTTADAAAAN